ncbi:MAG: tetratricopeptide repeat-containing protein, partial [Propionibacteriaceae bacterium]|nr:tetratricopeptide repeat-containing protein [Propionibacteriaceae bacterium]
HGNEHGAAFTYHQLGRVAKELGDFDAAEGLYRNALAIFEKLQDSHNAEIAKRSIARLERLRNEVGQP